MISKGKKRGDNDWSDWGGYMRTKIRKLDEQFELMKDGDDQNKIQSDLFKNVVIFVNGYTIPSSDELKNLMTKYGGGFQHYYSKSRCTHIVATNLPNNKINELKGEKVVHPNWIIDSIQQGKLLPHRDYLLYGVGGKYRDTETPKGSMMNFVKASDVSTEVKLGTSSDITMIPQFDDSDVFGETLCNSECIEPNPPNESNEETPDFTSKHTLSKSPSDTDSTNSNSGQCYKSYSEIGHPDECNTSVSENVDPSRIISDRKRASVPKAGDANFVSDYYSHSRLHYLSTWGAEFKDFINNLIQTTELKTSRMSPLKTTSKSRVIMHVDMDSFFVSVALRTRPELKGKPVVVCHAGRGSGASSANGSDNSSSFGSTSDIASCSYEARSCGVKNGMWLGQARQLCPGLVCVPYEFRQYREVSQQLYEILASYTHKIQAVSCDEAFVDVTHYTESERISPLQLAQSIRDKIQSKTNCPASAGIGPNILLARMCTRVAKPNGQFHLQPQDVQEFISSQKVKDLPGVGYSLTQKLDSLNVVTCLDLQRISLQVLRREFGRKTGDMLNKYCRGEDDRELKIERERKSISAEINYAIRFQEDSEPEKFIYDLSNEVHRRMKSAGVKGKHLTFKLKVRQKDAPINPSKFMGCGRCDNMSRSSTLAFFTDESNIIANECVSMLKQLAVTVSDIRGMGIQVSKLSSDNRISSSSTKTLRYFMKPFAKTASNLPSVSDENSDICLNVDGYKGQKTSKPFLSRTLELLPSDSDDASDKASKPDEDKNKKGLSAEVSTVTARTTMSGTVNNTLINVPSVQGCKALFTPKKSGKGDDVITMENDDGFKLVLSDDELVDEQALNTGQRVTKHNIDAPVGEVRQQNTTTTGNSNSMKNTDLPPLPVFPIFSLVRTTPKKASPARAAKKSPARSPGPSNKASPGRSKKASPGRSKNRSPGRSPVRPSSQRSLLGIFQSPTCCDVATSLSLPSPSQIDPAVFEALPDEIKKDIEKSYQQRNQRFTLTGDGTASVSQSDELQFPSPSHWDPEVLNCLPPEIAANLRDEYQRTEKREVPKIKKSKTRTITSFTSTKNPSKHESGPPSLETGSATTELDTSFLEALPESLRHEIQLAYQQQRRYDEKEKHKQEKPTTINILPSDMSQKRPSYEDSVAIATPSPEQQVSLAGAQTLAEVREMLKLWTSTTQVPLDEDAIILMGYLSNLICQKDLEKMWLVLKFYRRLTFEKEAWHATFNTVLGSVQSMLNESYGSRLPIEYFNSVIP